MNIQQAVLADNNRALNFKKVTLEDKQWVDPLLVTGNLTGCHQNFTNIFAWSDIYQYRIARVDDYLIVKGAYDEAPGYFYPAGSGDLRTVFAAMREDAMNNGHRFRLVGVSPENISTLQKLFPDQLAYTMIREAFDYVYLLDKLVKLSGNKLHAKRNHMNRFKKENPDWRFEPITTENLADCWEMNQRWCEINTNNGEVVIEESCAVRRCFEHYGDLGLEGGLIRCEDRVVAFTMGEILNADTYVIHIEKAFSEVNGAYQMINREFAAYIQEKYPQMVYMNREEDMGLEGLRKAKLSYHPDKMEEKYLAVCYEV